MKSSTGLSRRTWRKRKYKRKCHSVALLTATVVVPQEKTIKNFIQHGIVFNVVVFILITFGFLVSFQVGRRVTPEEDAAVVQAVRRCVGDDVQIRADANRKWSYQQALAFSLLVRGCDLQYLEVFNPTLAFVDNTQPGRPSTESN